MSQLDEILQKEAEGEALLKELDPYHLFPLPGVRVGSAAPAVGPLRAERLRFEGTFGFWDASQFLEPSLWLGFVEPRSLRYEGADPRSWAWPRAKFVDPRQDLALQGIWAKVGLLSLVRDRYREYQVSQVGNVYKDPAVDRQIFDRRGPNGAEAQVADGPSGALAMGSQLVDWLVAPFHSVCVYGTDRKDFYHRFAVTPERIESNATGCRRSLGAYQEFPGDPVGALLDKEKLTMGRRGRRALPKKVRGAFATLPMGDHIAVDVAQQSHGNVLKQAGALKTGCLLGGMSPVPESDRLEGLCIDDYFFLRQLAPGQRRVAEDDALWTAVNDAYADQGLPGSSAKAFEAEPRATVVGAEIDGGLGVARGGAVLVGAPRDRRLALSALSLMTARGRLTSGRLLAMLAGSWVSVFAFRRPLMCVLQGVFGSPSTDLEQVFTLPRGVSNELVVAAVLAPLASTNIQTPVSNALFAMDASPSKGAYTEVQVGQPLARALWRHGARRGGYSRLEGRARATRRELGALDPDEEEAEFAEEDARAARPPAFFYEVLLLGDATPVRSLLKERGVSCSPLLTPSHSRWYDLEVTRFFEWVLFMIGERRILMVVVWGTDETIGSALRERRRRFLLRFCAREEVPLLYVAGKEEAEEASRTGEGREGSPPLRLLPRGLPPRSSMLVVAPAFLSPAAGLPFEDFEAPALGAALATYFVTALRRWDRRHGQAPRGFERPAVNELLLRAEWHTSRSWRWPTARHINLLESATVYEWLSDLALRGESLRITGLVDSRVALCSTTKGRSPSRALQRSLGRIAAVTVAGGLYPSFHFAPTRLNVADAPTRDRPLPAPWPGGLEDLERRPEVWVAAPPSPAARSAWCRLVLRLGLSPQPSPWTSSRRWAPSSRHLSRSRALEKLGRPAASARRARVERPCDQASYGGFPGEGPRGHREKLSRARSRDEVGRRGGVRRGPWGRRPRTIGSYLRWVGYCILVVGSPTSAVPPSRPPPTKGDYRRAARREELLPRGRPVDPLTKSRREVLLQDFDAWLRTSSRESLDTLLAPGALDVYKINYRLELYGQTLWSEGRAYWKYAETINGVVGLRGELRRQVSRAWDLAFAWRDREPGQRHLALPLEVLRAMLAVALCWRWVRFAALLAAGWTGLLRPMEILGAVRSQVVLPRDVMFSVPYVLWAVVEPKTKRRGARFQSARVDDPEVVELLSLSLGHLPPGARVWPAGPSAFRRRFDAIVDHLGVGGALRAAGSRALDLGSLRAGGATALFEATENPELVKIRGRWSDTKTMMIYVQELTALSFVPKLPRHVKVKLQTFASATPELLQLVFELLRSQVPTSYWHMDPRWQ